MLAKLICAEDKSLVPKRLFGSYVLVALVISLWSATMVFAPTEFAEDGAIALGFFGGVLFLFMIFLIEDTKKLRVHGLLGANWKQSFILLGLFLPLNICLGFMVVTLTADMAAAGHTLSQIGKNSLPMLLGFPFSAIFLFGEEYGWRYYFQPLLQKKFGLIKGVILLGVLWGLWHANLDLFYFPISSAVQMGAFFAIVMHQVVCISVGIFLAYVYMKTNNIWLPVTIHFLYNHMGNFFFSEIDYTWSVVALVALPFVVIFWPFLFSKVFRKPRGELGGMAMKG